MKTLTPRSPKARKTARRGQAEIIGGLIVLTLIFMFAVPIILNSYFTAQKTVEVAKTTATQKLASFNERLTIEGISPDNELAIRAGWIPGVFINNTGTVDVVLDKLYLIDIVNNTIFAVLDLRYARPATTDIIKDMAIDVDPTGAAKQPPPVGQPIVLKPGQNLVIAFNDTILPYASNLVVKIESATGILHPLAGEAAGTNRLYPGRPGAGSVEQGAWRGIFAPQSGFKLIGFDEIVKFSNIWAERPCYLYSFSGRTYYGWAISNDPDYPPYYNLEFYRYWYYVNLRGFLGTFDWDPEDSSAIRVEGWYVGSNGCISRKDWSTIYWDRRSYAGSWKVFTYGDMDYNGVNELVFFTYWIHYYGGSDVNPDSDGDGSSWRDSIAGMVQVARDLSGVDYVKIAAKVIYDLAIYGDGQPTNPLKVFSLVVWRYDPDRQSWVIVQAKDFEFINMGPKIIEISSTFPLNRTDTYRVGVIFYDPYMRTYSGAYYEFMISLEHLIVEYGVLNPLFKESPPLYIVAIPDPDIIKEIGEYEYAAIKNLTLDEAKVEALKDILRKLEDELNYAGVAGYTVIDSRERLCELLFSDNPPKYAVVMWLQGGVSISDVTQGSSCYIDDYTLKDYMSTYHWVWVWPYGEPFGDKSKITTYIYYTGTLVTGPFNMTITEAGIEARRLAYAYHLYNNVNFTLGFRAYTDQVLILNATFYKTNISNVFYYGTVGLWLWIGGGFGGGALVLNPVHVDWDLSGDGASPETIVQQIVYSSLRAWEIVREEIG